MRGVPALVNKEEYPTRVRIKMLVEDRVVVWELFDKRSEIIVRAMIFEEYCNMRIVRYFMDKSKFPATVRVWFENRSEASGEVVRSDRVSFRGVKN